MGQVLGVGVIALIVIFQPEIRRFLLHLGSRYASANRGSFFRRLFKNRGGVNAVSYTHLDVYKRQVLKGVRYAAYWKNMTPTDIFIHSNPN